MPFQLVLSIVILVLLLFWTSLCRFEQSKSSTASCCVRERQSVMSEPLNWRRSSFILLDVTRADFWRAAHKIARVSSNGDSLCPEKNKEQIHSRCRDRITFYQDWRNREYNMAFGNTRIARESKHLSLNQPLVWADKQRSNVHDSIAKRSYMISLSYILSIC